jgi:hypothetical protein
VLLFLEQKLGWNELSNLWAWDQEDSSGNTPLVMAATSPVWIHMWWWGRRWDLKIPLLSLILKAICPPCWVWDSANAWPACSCASLGKIQCLRQHSLHIQNSHCLRSPHLPIPKRQETFLFTLKAFPQKKKGGSQTKFSFLSLPTPRSSQRSDLSQVHTCQEMPSLWGREGFAFLLWSVIDQTPSD